MSHKLVKQLQKIEPSIKRVEDAKRPLTLHVTAADIAKSNRKDATSCALAQACIKKKHPVAVIANRSRLYIVNQYGVARRYSMPNNAKRELTSFDRGASFAPGDYTMAPVQPSQRLGSESRKRPTNPNKKTKPTRRKLVDDIRVALR